MSDKTIRMEDGGFQVIGSGGGKPKRNHKKRVAETSHNNLQNALHTTTTKLGGSTGKNVHERIVSLRDVIKATPLFSSLLNLLLTKLPTKWNYESVDLVCMGIGPLGTSTNSKYQFALLTLIKEVRYFSNCIIYDPMMSPKDIELCTTFGIRFTEISIGRYKAQRNTLFFMPHCPRALYNNLLYENWKSENLSKIVLIGNSFSGYEVKQISKKFQKCLIHRLADHMIEHSLTITDNDTELFMAFNDTSVLVPNMDLLYLQNSDFWDNIGEISVDELVSETSSANTATNTDVFL